MPSRFISEVPKELLSGFYGGLDEKEKNNRTFISKKGLKRRKSEYEMEELIELEGVTNVTKIRQPNQFQQPTANSQKLVFSIGDKVQHETFGAGTVEQIIGQGNKQLLNISFEKQGKKLLDPRFAKLIKL